MKRSVAYPDNYTKMSVSDAKQPFVEETIAYECQLLANKMKLPAFFF